LNGVTIPATPGSAYSGSGRALSVPAPPPDYTIIGFMGSVAYVPAKKGAKAAKRPPLNFVEATHPKAGRIYLPNGYAATGAARKCRPVQCRRQLSMSSSGLGISA
jgi:hypothetical protein